MFDAYDVLWGTISMDVAHYEMARVYQSLDELLTAIEERTLPEGLDLLVMGNWIHPTAHTEDSKSAVELSLLARIVWSVVCAESFSFRLLLRSLHDLELDLQLRVFPPLDYAWYFAQKALCMMRAGQLLPMSLAVQPIPTLPVSLGRTWKLQVQEFARTHGATKLMFKREISECKEHAVLFPRFDGLGLSC
jgi:hypothetical protein